MRADAFHVRHAGPGLHPKYRQSRNLQSPFARAWAGGRPLPPRPRRQAARSEAAIDGTIRPESLPAVGALPRIPPPLPRRSQPAWCGSEIRNRSPRFGNRRVGKGALSCDHAAISVVCARRAHASSSLHYPSTRGHGATDEYFPGSTVPGPLPTLRSVDLCPAEAELGEDLVVVLAERGRRRVDPGPAMGKGEGGKRDAEPALHAGGAGMAVNDAAG